MTTERRVLVAVAITITAWASAFIAIRWVGSAFAPGSLTLGRLLVGSLALGAVQAIRGTWVQPTRREWALLAVCGLLWFAVYNVALNAAEQRLDAGTTAMLVNIGPILIALFAGVLLGEGFPRWLVIGAAVAFSGALLIAIATSRSQGVDLVGVVLALVAAIAYAVGVVAQKPVLGRLPALQVTWLACTIGMVASLPFIAQLLTDITAASPARVGGLIYLGLVPTALAFSTWAFALARTSAGKLGVTTYLVPPLTIVGAWILLAEIPPPLAIIGGMVSLVGVALSRRRD